jgi:hypothetical protein
MTTTPVSWTITAIGSDTVTAAAHAPDHTTAWTDALRAARTALLTGDLDTLTVTIGNNHCGAFYTPARDEHGRIIADQLTAALIDLHHAATAGELADQLSSPPA